MNASPCYQNFVLRFMEPVDLFKKFSFISADKVRWWLVLISFLRKSNFHERLAYG
jgi:hypothetical protein